MVNARSLTIVAAILTSLAASQPAPPRAEDLFVQRDIAGRHGGRLVMALRTEPRTLNPVAVNYQCWAARRASAHVSPDGPGKR